MRTIAVYLATLCVQHTIIEPSLFDWCVYSIEKRIISILSWIFLLFIGSSLFGIAETCVFLTSFLWLRKSTNGYHASSYLGCISLSLLVEIVCLLTAPHLPHSAANAVVLLADALIYLYAPHNDIKIHLSTAELVALRSRSRQLLLFFNALYIFLSCFRSSPANYIAMALIADAVSLLFSKNDTP